MLAPHVLGVWGQQQWEQQCPNPGAQERLRGAGAYLGLFYSKCAEGKGQHLGPHCTVIWTHCTLQDGGHYGHLVCLALTLCCQLVGLDTARRAVQVTGTQRAVRWPAGRLAQVRCAPTPLPRDTEAALQTLTRAAVASLMSPLCSLCNEKLILKRARRLTTED